MWFSLSVENMRYACKPRPVRVLNYTNNLLSNKRWCRESEQEWVGDLKANQVDTLTRNINERQDVNSIEQAIEVLERKPLICDYLNSLLNAIARQHRIRSHFVRRRTFWLRNPANC